MHSIKVVGLTKPLVEGLESSEDLIVHNARVSNPSNQLNTDTGAGLLRYCIKHKHFSIFEMANMVVEIITTRDISRQILRHRSFSFQEFSGRYSVMPEDPIIRETRLQDPVNKQGSLECIDDSLSGLFNELQHGVWEEALDSYKYLLSKGVSKEQARALLPEGLVQTRMYMNGTVRSWIHYCQVRCGVETQKEHRLIAKDICKELISNFPSLKDTLSPLLEDNYSAEQCNVG